MFQGVGGFGEELMLAPALFLDRVCVETQVLGQRPCVLLPVLDV